MRDFRSLRAALAVLSLAGAADGAAAGVNDGNGKEWRQLPETTFVSWNQLAAVCPLDGASPCAGLANGRDVTGWIWATQPQLAALFQQYDASVDANGNSTSVWSGFAANAFLGVFQPTFSFASTYQAGGSASGWTATTDASGLPLEGSVGWSTNLVSFSGGFGIGPVADASSATQFRGAWLWRSTGLGGGVVANDDAGRVASPAGGVAVANVLANDFVDGAPATLANAALSPSEAGSLALEPTTGQVVVALGAAAGSHALTYQVCALADPEVCDDAVVTVTVPAYTIDAVNDAGTAPPTGGVAVASVLTNDKLGAARADSSSVGLALVSSSSPSVSLDLADGSVDVAAGSALGAHSLVYRICERANPTNCDQASVAVNVARHVVVAGDESARASSKVASTAIASVFANDSVGGVRASSSNVQLSLLTRLPPKVVLDATTGAVRVTGKTSSGTYRFTYRICERADAGNCDDAVVTLDLSGKGN